MKRLAYGAFALGIVLFAAIILYVGAGDVAAALVSGGWALPAIVAWHIWPLAIDAQAWRLLFARGLRPDLARACALRWVCEAVNNLLPVAQLGGEFARARLAARGAISLSAAGAAGTADVTLGALTQVPFALVGLAGLAVVSTSEQGYVLWTLGVGLGALTVLVLAFVRFQQAGPGQIAMELFRRFRPGAARTADPAALDREIGALYARRGPLALAAFWRLAAWFAGAGEIWLALHFLGSPISVPEAIVLESVLQLVRSVAFLVPAALGVQEGALVLLASAFGFSPEIGLAVSLLRRGRDVVLGVPGLVFWQMAEGVRLRARL
ncbi:MAG: lysylphosphatidylglycerol synthase domain-containing protein [Alphaproteobacteria bacterium]